VEPVAEIIAALERHGMVFWADRTGLRFAYEDAALEPGDSARVGELVLEREDEAVAFIRRRARTDDFGKFAGLFRSAVYKMWNLPEMLPWLRERCPSLYSDLTLRLPDRICTLWQEAAPMEEFERAIRGLEEAQSCAVNFFLVCQREANPKEKLEE
jgi:hypothetical protein